MFMKSSNHIYTEEELEIIHKISDLRMEGKLLIERGNSLYTEAEKLNDSLIKKWREENERDATSSRR